MIESGAPEIGLGAPVSIVAPRPRERSFRAYNVGIAKTGTRSVAGIFARYRALHEFLFRDTVRAIHERECGTLTEEAFREFVRSRDALTRLDMDSSSYNCAFTDVLVQEFADAKFVFVIRDCYAWLDSMLNMSLFIGPLMTDWMADYIEKFLGPGFEMELSNRPDVLQSRLPGMVEAGLRYWATMNQFVLDNLPVDRSLILRTRELTESLPLLSSFLCVPEETLEPQLSLLNKGERKYHLLHQCDRNLLAQLSEHYCSDLMHEFFPEVILDDYLTRDIKWRLAGA